MRQVPRRLAISAVLLLLSGAVTVNLSSCATILLSRTGNSSRRAFSPGDVALSRIPQIPDHPWVRLVTTRGDTVAGEFGGIGLQPLIRYRPRFDAWRAAGHPDVPDLEEPVTLIPTSESRRFEMGPARTPASPSGAFAGFGAGTIRIRTGGQEVERALESLAAVNRASGDRLSTDSLIAFAAGNQLPSRAQVRLRFTRGRPARLPDGVEVEGGTGLIAIDDIQSFSLEGGIEDSAAPILVGLAIDTAVLALLLGPKECDTSGCASSR